MKITIVVGAFFPVPPTMGGAVEKMWYALAKQFACREHEVVIVSRKLPELPVEETVDRIRYLRVRGFNTPRSLIWLKFLDLLYSLNAMSVLPAADLLVTNTFWLPILVRDSERGKIYVHVGRHPKGQMRFYQRAARLQAPSAAIARTIADQAPQLARKISIIPYPSPTSLTASSPESIAGREKTILFVGRIHPEKGVHVLIEAFASGARTAFSDWKLMIVGPTETKLGGGGEAYIALLRRASGNAHGNVTFAGPIFDSTKLANVFQDARLFVYPSLSERGESFGLAPLEAMAHGCAVLVSNLDCFRDFIRDGETGFIFDHRMQPIAQTLRDKIDHIISNETLVARVAAAGYEKSADYSPERVAAKFLNDFDAVIRN